MRRVLFAISTLLALCASAPAGASAFGVVNSPAAGSVHGATIPIDVNTQVPGSNIRVLFTYTGGGNAPDGALWTITLNGSYTSNVFTTSTTDLASSGSVASVTPSNGASGTSLPEGQYSVQLRFWYLAGAMTVTTSAVTSVTIDRTTQAPTINSPSDGYTHDSTDGPLVLSYDLAETIQNLTLTLSSPGQTTRVLDLSSMVSSGGSHVYTLDHHDLTSSPNVDAVTGGAALPDGSWTMTLSGQDVLGNPAASSPSKEFLLDTTTLPPTLSAPLPSEIAGNYISGSIDVTYTLPEDASPGAVLITFAGVSTSRTLTVSGTSAGTHTVTVVRGALSASTGVLAVGGGDDTLPDGTYSVWIQYADQHLNDAATAGVPGVVLAPPPAADPPPAQTPPAEAPPPAADRTPPKTLAPSPWRIHVENRTTSTGAWSINAWGQLRDGADRYEMVLRRSGRKPITVSCKKRRTDASCQTTVTSPGAWKVTLNARNRAGRIIDSATRTVETKARKKSKKKSR